MECPLNKACINQKCVDPCPGSCGINANCAVVNHSPICSCEKENTGDPFTRCFPIPRKKFDNFSLAFPKWLILAPERPIETNPCQPSPCGPNSVCRNVGGSPSCACLPEFNGSPPQCRPECTINPECLSSLACFNQKCIDPCPGSCGLGAQCSVINHIPVCTCLEGYTGDPFTQCVIKPSPPPRKINNIVSFFQNTILLPLELEVVTDPCNPSPCGANAICADGICTCLPEHHGDPYRGCRPECIVRTDCPTTKTCIRNKCVDPCPNTCGENAVCNVWNHIPMCSCREGYTGNAFIGCSKVLGKSFLG